MKKFITAFLVAAACSLGGFAQSLAFVQDDKEYTSGEISSSHVEDGFWDGAKIIHADLFLKNKSSETQDVRATLKTRDGKQWQFCFGGTCSTNTEFDKTSSMAAGESQNLLIEYTFELPTEDFTTIADLTASLVSKPSDKIEATLILKYTASGISTEVLKNEVKVLDNVLYYDMENASGLSIYDLSGREIKRMALSNQSDEISLNDLKAGLYLYKLNSGSSAVAGKFVIR